MIDIGDLIAIASSLATVVGVAFRISAVQRQAREKMYERLRGVELLQQRCIVMEDLQRLEGDLKLYFREQLQAHEDKEFEVHGRIENMLQALKERMDKLLNGQ